MKPRPLSPHIQIYRWPLAMVLSIAHRASGIALTLGTVLLAVWIISVTSLGSNSYAQFDWIFYSRLGRTILFLWSLALFYHLCNGIRHLFWDLGAGFSKGATAISNWLVIGFTLGFTALTWWIGIAHQFFLNQVGMGD